jgi:ABC-type nickel/cobalt efflux system permease component RcnA
MNFYDEFIKTLIHYQFKINSYISSTIKNIDDENTLISWLIVLSIAFLYGLIHAAGPGHGKALVAFYFSTSKNAHSQAFKLGYLISIIHAISALVLTFGIYFILESMFRQNFNYYSKVTMLISAVMIMLVGFYIIISSYLSRKQKKEKVQKNKSKYALAFSAGVVPCPGIMTIVLFCIMLKQYLLGILAAITMSIGMGFTISLVGILSITLNKKTNNILQSKGFILEIIGGFLILFLGIFLLSINYVN